MTRITGPILLKDPEQNSESTGPQVRSVSLYDSRLSAHIYPLTYPKIRQLRKDPTCVLAKWAVLAPMIHTPWVYKATEIGKNLATPEMIDTVQDSFEPLRDRFLQQSVYGACDYGWQPFEAIYTPVEGSQVRITNLKALLPDFTDILVYVDSGEFAGFVNKTLLGIDEVLVHKEYALNINFSVEGTDWYGTSVFEALQGVLTSWDNVEETASRFDSKIAGAAWVIYYPVGSTPYNNVKTPNHDIALDLMSKLKASGGICIPDEIQSWMDDTLDKSQKIKSKWRVELITADASSAASFIDRQKYLDALKMRAFGFPERAILEGKHGTKEEADVHGDVALSIVDTKHRLICDALNAGPVRNLIRLHYGRKFENSVCIEPAPLVDNQFATVKEIYRLILQTPETLVQEVQNISLKIMRDKLGIPNSGEDVFVGGEPELEKESEKEKV